MSTMNLASIAAAAILRPKVLPSDLEVAMQPCLTVDEDGEPRLRDHLGEAYAAACDLVLQDVLRAYPGSPRTLRVEVGYGWPEYEREWLRLGGEFMADAGETPAAMEFLRDPEIDRLLTARLEAATRQFIQERLPAEMFTGAQVSYYLHERPVWHA